MIAGKKGAAAVFALASFAGLSWSQSPADPPRGDELRAQARPAAAQLGRPTVAQNPNSDAGGAPKNTGSAPKGDVAEALGILLQLTPPPPERLFEFKSEAQVRAQIREDFKNIRKVEFPPSPEIVPAPRPIARLWPYVTAVAEPSYVCFKRLWFEQRNFERYGYDYGVLQPVISTGVFYTDLALMPLHWLSHPLRWYDCSAGQCLPGDPVPLLWNPFLWK
jgi:hypothetical protein